MAIEKKLTANSGFEPEYWIVSSISWEKRTSTSTIVIKGYRSKEYFKNGAKEAGTAVLKIKDNEQSDIRLIDFSSDQNIVKLAYDVLKRRVEFLGGKDI